LGGKNLTKETKIDWELADKIYAREEDKILENMTKEMQNIAQDCSKRGVANSSISRSIMHRAHHKGEEGTRNTSRFIGLETKEDTKPNLVKLFIYSYSHKDENMRDSLETHLALLKRQGLITSWHDRRITAGEEWADQIDKHLEEADIILLLVSADFLASYYCYDIEMKRALERHELCEVRVIPIIILQADWHEAPFAKLQVLTKDAKPVNSWDDADEVWLDVAQGIRRVVEQLRGT
jgi:hypothetical protein